jgi:hypothetical protein
VILIALLLLPLMMWAICSAACPPPEGRLSDKQRKKLTEVYAASAKEAEERRLRIREQEDARKREKRARDDKQRLQNWAALDNSTWRPETHEDRAFVLGIARLAVGAGADQDAVLARLRVMGLTGAQEWPPAMSLLRG